MSFSLLSAPYAPSLASNMTLGSRTSTVCHEPLGTWRRAQVNPLRLAAVVIIQYLVNTAEKTHDALRRHGMPVDIYLRARKQHVQHPLRAVMLRVAQIHIRGSNTFNILCEPSCSELRRSTFVLNLVLAAASLKSPSRYSFVIFIICYIRLIAISKASA